MRSEGSQGIPIPKRQREHGASEPLDCRPSWRKWRRGKQADATADWGGGEAGLSETAENHRSGLAVCDGREQPRPAGSGGAVE